MVAALVMWTVVANAELPQVRMIVAILALCLALIIARRMCVWAALVSHPVAGLAQPVAQVDAGLFRMVFAQLMAPNVRLTATKDRVAQWIFVSIMPAFLHLYNVPMAFANQVMVRIARIVPIALVPADRLVWRVFVPLLAAMALARRDLVKTAPIAAIAAAALESVAPAEFVYLPRVVARFLMAAVPDDAAGWEASMLAEELAPWTAVLVRQDSSASITLV